MNILGMFDCQTVAHTGHNYEGPDGIEGVPQIDRLVPKSPICKILQTEKKGRDGTRWKIDGRKRQQLISQGDQLVLEVLQTEKKIRIRTRWQEEGTRKPGARGGSWEGLHWCRGHPACEEPDFSPHFLFYN